MLIYITGKYRGDVDANVAIARKVAVQVWQSGHDAVCPHLNTHNMDLDTGLPDDFWLAATMRLLSRCDGMILCPDWRESEGAQAEMDYAMNQGMPIWEYPNMPPVCLTEQRSPVQCQAFLEVIMRMYRLHLSKNADYSPMNILGTGELGVIVRLWDKIARLMNLSGFRIHAELLEFSANRKPNNESIEDTLLDAAVYAIIGLLLRADKWGK